jgi:hypothetical protein
MITRPSLRKATNQACQDCIYDSTQEGSWRQQVAKCTSPNCALFSVRPMPIAIPHRGQPRSLILAPELPLKGPLSEHDGGVSR